MDSYFRCIYMSDKTVTRRCEISNGKIKAKEEEEGEQEGQKNNKNNYRF